LTAFKEFFFTEPVVFGNGYFGLTMPFIYAFDRIHSMPAWIAALAMSLQIALVF
jgi:hypothetical protein